MKTKFNINIYSLYKLDFINRIVVNHLRYALFPKDNAVTSSIIDGWQYQEYLFTFLEKNNIKTYGKDIIDVGANNGSFSIDFSHLVGDEGKVHSFEPQRIIYYQLCGNVFMNGIDNVYCYNNAVGDTHEDVKIEKPNYYNDGFVNFGDVKVQNSLQDNFEYVKCTTLDSFDFKDVVFIKIDVQGYEPYVLRGAVETIKKHRPYLYVEFEEDLLIKYNSSEYLLKKQIEDMGYIIKFFCEGIPYQTDTGRCLDGVCIPIEKASLNHIIP